MTHSGADAIEALKRGDHVLAFQEALRSAQEGNVSGQSNVAAFYATGTGVEQNFAEALKWWQRAAEQGMLGAEYSIGCLYLNGQGVPRDSYQAAAYLRKSAEQGHAAAQYNLGCLYVEGREYLGTRIKPMCGSIGLSPAIRSKLTQDSKWRNSRRTPYPGVAGLDSPA